MKYVYCVRNVVNEKRYVGQTYSLSQREYQHFSEGRKNTSDHPLYRSMRKHGLENFKFEVLEECSDSLINEREIHWISYFDSTNPDKGYNLTRGGQEIKAETRKKLSEALKGNKHCLGRVLSPEHAAKIKNNWLISQERKLGKRDVVTEMRTCVCGKQFEVTFARNRKAYVKKNCSRSCANARTKG